MICLDPDRLSRRLLNQLLLTDEFERYGVELRFVNGDYSKTPEGTLFYALRGAISEFEKAKITERMCRGRREKAKQGKILRDFHVYGYDYDRNGRSVVKSRGSGGEDIFRWFLDPPKDAGALDRLALDGAGRPLSEVHRGGTARCSEFCLTLPISAALSQQVSVTPQASCGLEEWDCGGCPLCRPYHFRSGSDST